MEVTIKAEVCPTENKEKVKRAITNLFYVEVVEEIEERRTYLVGVAKSRESLERFYTLIRSQCILDAARKIFTASIDGNSITFGLNKQVAYVGSINFSYDIFEKGVKSSPLNTVVVKIADEKIKELIDWMAPSTI